MIRKNILHVCRNSKVQLLEQFLVAFGTIWLLIEFPSALFKIVRDFFEEKNVCVLVIAALSSLVFGVSRVYPRMVFTRKFESNTGASITLKVGDIFDQPDHIVVGTSDYFDTEYLKDAKKSLKTQMVQRFFNGNLEVIDRAILDSLERQTALLPEFTLSKPVGKKLKYPVGTIATFPIDGDLDRKVFLLVISKKSYPGGVRRIECTSTDLAIALDALWERVQGEGRQRPISIPILGTGLAGISLPRLFLMQTIILSYAGYLKSKRKPSDNLNIVIFESDYDPGDFAEASRLLKKMQI